MNSVTSGYVLSGVKEAAIMVGRIFFFPMNVLKLHEGN